MRLKALVAVCTLALATASFTLADEKDRRIVFTFDKPVSIPPVHQEGWGVLPPGTYVFKLLDNTANKHIVQIFNKEETKIYATVLAIPNMRYKPADKVIITFRETAAGQPFAIRTIFYPGRLYGEEFVYPKTVATQLARATGEPVLAMPAELAKEEAKPEAAAVVAELEKAPVTAIEPTGTEVAEAQAVTPPADIQAAGNVPFKALPNTASPLPLLVLTGFVALGLGLTFGFAERRRAAVRSTTR